MAPRLRSEKGLSRDEVLAHQKAMRAGPVNTTGFPGLPTELLIEITSYFPTIPIPAPDIDHDIYSSAGLERREVLAILSQMCQSLRSVFLPCLWERIEACSLHNDSRGRDEWHSYHFGHRRHHTRLRVVYPWEKFLATELVQQLEITTIRDPTLAQYVKIVNTVPTPFSSDTVMAELVRCLSLFPNLHTIQMLGRRGDSQSFENAFKGHQFPSVRTLVVPAAAAAVVLSCPMVTTVNSLSGPLEIIQDAVFSRCTEVEALYGFEFVDHTDPLNGKTFLQGIVEYLPRTRVVSLNVMNVTLHPDMIEQLSKLPKLCCIEIAVDVSADDLNYPDSISHFSQLIEQAKRVLRASAPPQGQQKRLLLKCIDMIVVIAVPHKLTKIFRTISSKNARSPSGLRPVKPDNFSRPGREIRSESRLLPLQLLEMSTTGARKVVVLISGSGTNLQALIDAQNTPALPNTQIILVFSNRKSAYGLTRAAQANPPIPTAYLALQPYLKGNPGKTRTDYDAEVARLVLRENPDLIILAGWMHIFGDGFLELADGRKPLVEGEAPGKPIPVINLHPALPGAFDGAHAIERSYEAFQKGEIPHSGAMVHRVVKDVDRGEPLIVKDVHIIKDEPIEAFEERLHKVEREIIVQAAAKVLEEVKPSQASISCQICVFCDSSECFLIQS
ncbi:Phosphoribosylglycinamide formyltransferase [Hypsizygus marmoreus]|uniref:phosphoribosylglycinamide formyltransferase 1 n=1 Tax=Hypsizygus marmoreus TaxID=39966 RepID=A0A369JLF4_HYPMA|nr:Phosphoribosylglycinamide formyltransferase [Hypsizygus marmoreus]